MANPGYANELGTVGYFFTARDAFHTDDITRTDIALNYSFTFGKRFEIFVQPEVLNVFDEDGVIDAQHGGQMPATGVGLQRRARWRLRRRSTPSPRLRSRP